MAGPIGFFKGMGARVLYSMPATAICWSTYEFFKFILSSQNNDHYRSSAVSGASTNKTLEKIHDSDTDDQYVGSVRYVIPKPPVITSDIVTDSSNSIHHNAATETSINGSQFVPATSRELPSISGVGVYTAINMNPMQSDRVYDPGMRSCSR